MEEQIMKFQALYQNNREAVVRALTSMWCGEVNNDSQKAYVEQIKEQMSELFAPKEAIPVVQCVNRYVTTKHSREEVEELIGNLWNTAIYNPKKHDDYFLPYEHQYLSWHTLLKEETKEGKPMSICVTTGTGSGKTECFMLPLVKDLTEHFHKDCTQAIFLYPLNALMEDQKERMEKILAGTELRYAVYNGDLPEEEPKENDHSKRAERIRRKIEAIKGIERDKDGKIKKDENGEIIQKYKHIIATRDELREHPANILLTNPTMLEYILLRKKDERLINPKLHSLRWVAIDETHTYTGAGAAELAMLIRRVLLAFDVKASDIQFSTSSATLGNLSSIVDEEEKEKAKKDQEKELTEFISKITGIEDKDQIKIIGGDLTNVKALYELPQGEKWRKLIKNEYVTLNELFPNEGSIENQLKKLDEMCDLAPKDGSVRVKVHYFYRSPNGGLFVKLTQHNDGCFKVYSENDVEGTDGAPMLELSRCKQCGEFVAIGEVDEQNETYQPLTMDDSDMFDLDAAPNGKKKHFIFGLTNKPLVKDDDNISITVNGNHFKELKSYDKAAWRVIANTQCKCPYCGSKLTRKSLGSDESGENEIEEDNKKLMKFRVSTDFIARLIAPSTLDQLVKHHEDDDTLSLHNGQQYISFVDSRQAAAKSTLKQNLEEERLWVYSKIYHELCRRKLSGKTVGETIDELNKKSTDSSISIDDRMALLTRIQELLKLDPGELLPNEDKGYLTWLEITELLESDEIVDIYAYQFAKRTQGSVEVDINGNISPLCKHKYVQSIMIECLGVRPKSSKAPETMGLFTTYYPNLKDVLEMDLPQEVKNFNDAIKSDNNKISKNDWKDLMQVFLDYNVRSDQSVFLKLRGDDPIDIFACTRFSTKKESRRSVREPNPKSKGKRPRIVSYLGKLLMDDGQYTSVKAAVLDNLNLIQGVTHALWISLTDIHHLLEHSLHYDEKSQEVDKFEKDKLYKDKNTGEEFVPYRLNLAKLSFKLYDHVSLCDTNTSEGVRHVPCYRPVGTTFKEFSPYIIDGKDPERIDKKFINEWEPYIYYRGSDHDKPSDAEIKEWAKEKRKLLWDNQLWGEDGILADHLLEIHKYPNLFVQAEHTAQVDKMVAREVQQNFKKHTINVLACSTTMEMGVDLGDLEVVMMTSVPPMPSNYKQRAGRSGRNNLVRSASITLCGSDAVGMRTLYNPMANIIGRRVASPTVDLNSVQVIQRHVNAFLIREFGVFAMGDHAGSVNQKVIDYYTKYKFIHEGNHIRIEGKEDSKHKNPTDGLGDYDGTPFNTFNNKCLESITDKLRDNLIYLLRETVFEGRVEYVVEKAQANNQRCHDELQMMVEDLKDSYKNAKSENQKNFYMLKFIEPLDKQLLSYWATHRFTPNANMPVNVCLFDVNGDLEYYSSGDAPSNPSYPLREALSQYAPGNAVVLDGRVTTVRGVRYNDLYKRIVTLKKIYRNDEQTVIDNAAEISGKIKWPVTMTEAVELLQPTEFVPDMNEQDTRIIDKNIYTRVNAQLIGAAKWPDIVTEPHLFTARSNRECGHASILYYNEGIGYGYCHCSNCGRTVLETCAALSQDDPDELPADMNTIPHKTDPSKEDYHYKLQGKDSRAFCNGSYDKKYMHRNVVLGDVIQTDYTEIRIRHRGNSWIAKRTEDNQNLLITLGLLFASALADLLGKERTAIDMTITPNGHICIFDTNPGGSGYSNQLAEMQNMKEVLRKSMDIIKLAEDKHSRDALLDKFTLHYLDNLDVDAAKAWLEEEAESRKELPDEVKAVSENASETSLTGLLQAFKENDQSCMLFAADDYITWDYGGSEYGWRGHLLNYFSKKGGLTTFCILKSSHQYMNNPIKDMARDIRAWTSNIVEMNNPYKDVYPLAYINGTLYFTNSKENASLNDHWGNGTMYSAKVDFDFTKVSPADLEYVPGTINVWLNKSDVDKKRTSDIGKLIIDKGTKLIDEFKSYCVQSNEPITVIYQDDYLRSVLSMVISLQTIGQILKLIEKPFSIEYKMERYEEYGAPQNIIAPFRNSSKRNAILTDYTGEWLSTLGIKGVLIPIVSKEPRTLPHWRELSIKCGSKILHIYPDGGFANGWHWDKFTCNESTPREIYTQEDTKITDNIPVYLGEDIKIGFTITDE